ncbi:MAG: acetylxylan esterase [Clostridia bacterium]|nr:acetylxylan esterase [Clostridia bacterium]
MDSKYVAQREEALKKQIFPQTKKEDFADFWTEAVKDLRKKELVVKREKLSLPYDKTFTTYEITFNTHDDTEIHAYFSCPVGKENEKLPCVAFFHGGSGYKVIHHDILATGVCCFAMDVRSQGGTSVDKAVYTSGDRMGGLMTRGVLDKNEFYLKNIYLDAVRAMDVIATLDEVDPARIVTAGVSQGGALSIAASALSGRSAKCYSIVTSYCCLKERTESGSGVFDSTHAYLRVYPDKTDAVMDTLSYFDIVNMVSLLKVPVSFCLALADPICLPPYVYSAYHHAKCEKSIEMYPFVHHDFPNDYLLLMHRELAAL